MPEAAPEVPRNGGEVSGRGHGEASFGLSGHWLQAGCPLDAADGGPVLAADVLQWANGQEPLRRMVPARRREYLLGRQMARDLLRRAGGPALLVGTGADRQPEWPVGFSGSISHGAGWVAVVVGRGGGVGIDVEALLGEDDLPAVMRDCLVPADRALLASLDAAGRQELATVLFSAKEALFKCLYPAVRCWFDFTDAQVVDIDPAALSGGNGQGRLRLRLLRDLAPDVGAGREFDGWFRRSGHRVFTAFEY